MLCHRPFLLGYCAVVNFGEHMRKRIMRWLALARGRDPIKSGIFKIINNISYIIMLIIGVDFVLVLTGNIEAFSFSQAMLNFIGRIFVGIPADNSSAFELGYLVALLLIFLIPMLLVSILLWHNQERLISKIAKESQANHDNFIRIKERCSTQSRCFRGIGE